MRRLLVLFCLATALVAQDAEPPAPAPAPEPPAAVPEPETEPEPAPAPEPAPEAEPKPQPEPATPPAPNPVVVITTSAGVIHAELFRDECPTTVANFLGLAQGTKEFTDAKTGETAKRPYYDGLIFHRIIKDFMIQGGCPKGDGTGGPGYNFEDEISAKSLGLDVKAIGDKGVHPALQVRDQRDFQRNVLMPLVKKMGYETQEQVQANLEKIQEKLRTILPEITVEECLANLGYKYDDTRSSHHPKKGVLAMANTGPNTNGSQFFINLGDTPWLTGRHTVFGQVIEGMDIVEQIGAVKTGPGNRPIEDVTIVSVRLREDEPAEAPAPVKERDG